MGRLAYEKCPGVFLRAIAQFKNSLLTSESYLHSDMSTIFRAVVVGNGPLLLSLKNLARTLGIDTLVTFVGSVTKEEVRKLMLNANVLVNPRGSGETFGYVHAEAGSMGLPVIAFNRYMT